MAACAVLALGVVALVASQSQPARAASIGEFTMAPSGKLSDPEPLGSTIAIPAACPDYVAPNGTHFPYNFALILNVVKNGTELRAIDNIYNDADSPYDAPKSISLAAADNPYMVVNDLSQIFNSDGTYEIRLQCIDDTLATHPDSPYWTQKITVTGDNWVVGEGAKATTVATPDYSPSMPEPGQEVTLSATVTPADAVGTVTFLDGETPVNQTPIQVADGKAEFKTSALADGAHSITARFTPANSAEWGASVSQPRTMKVQLVRAEMLDASGTRLAPGSELQRGQTVKLIVRGCVPDTSYALTMKRAASEVDVAIPDVKADAGGEVTWADLTVPEDAVASENYSWVWAPNCDPTFTSMPFTVAEPPSGSPSPTTTDDPTDNPSDDPSDNPSDEATDTTSGTTTGGSDTGGSGTGGSSGTSSGTSGSGGTSPTGGLASTGSQIALFSGIGAVVLVAAGVVFVRFGRRNGLLTFGDPRS